MRSHLLVVPALAGLTAAVALGAPAGPAVIDPAVSGTKTFIVTCTTTTQVCDPPYRFTLKLRKGFRATRMRFTASKHHCSSMRIRVTVEGARRPVSAPIAPGATTATRLTALKPGKHTIAIRGIGIAGGCNIGYVGSWGGTIRIDAAPA
jgi:hypothetical protein